MSGIIIFIISFIIFLPLVLWMEKEEREKYYNPPNTVNPNEKIRLLNEMQDEYIKLKAEIVKEFEESKENETDEK